MGFFRKGWSVFTQLTIYAGNLGSAYSVDRQTLPVAESAVLPRDNVSPSGVSFLVPGTGFTCQYPSMTGYEACNTADNRTCWLQSSSSSDKQYNIYTDYENFSPQGVVREYWLEVDLKPVAPDGYLKTSAQVVNGTYPGPSLEACWGDQMVIHVTNKVANLGNTIHWHGIRQLHSNEMDGVNGITQCPIAYGDTFTYTFNITQYGHTWYHSHYQTQLADGVVGGLTLYGPSSASWDETEAPLLMSDWTHENSSDVFAQQMTGPSYGPITDNLVFNGTNTFVCADNDPLCCSKCTGHCTNGSNPEFCCKPHPGCFEDGVRQSGGISRKVFQEGKKYLFKLINTSAASMFLFSIDDHELEVIEADLVPIKPFKTDSLFVAIGQRYQVVVTAKPQQLSPACQQDSINCNYWVRTRTAAGCSGAAQHEETTGIISYDPASHLRPKTAAHNQDNSCIDVPVSDLQPVFQWDVEKLINSRTNYTFDADLSKDPFHGAIRWDLTPQPLYLNYSNPTILNTDNTALLENDPNLAVVNYTFSRTGDDDFVYLVITGDPSPVQKAQKAAPDAHPMHLHGHDFVILAQVDSTWNGTIPPNQTNNPPRRDTALLYPGGYLALAFKLDNPGVWALHCHILWHSASGLAMQILEQQHDIVASIGSLDQTKEICAGWDAMNLQFYQDDSGI